MREMGDWLQNWSRSAMSEKEKYAGLIGNRNAVKAEDEKLTSSITIPVTAEEKGLLKAAAYPEKMSDAYRPAMLKEARRLVKKRGLEGG